MVQLHLVVEVEVLQNRADRLLSPMRRNASGGYDAVDWDTALDEIAAKLEAVKNDFGGDKIFFYVVGYAKGR